MYRLLLALFPLLLLAQPDPRQLLRESADAIKRYKTYQLDSTVIVEMRGGNLDNRLEMPNSVSMRRPDRRRIESKNQTAAITIVSDAEFTWFYLTPLKQSIKPPPSGPPEAATGAT